MKRIINFYITILFFCTLVVVPFEYAAWSDEGAAIVVSPSSNQISVDDNISVQFKIIVNQYEAEIGKPQYDAPDFDEVNTYSGMSGVETTYINGNLTVKRTQTMTVVLHPKKAGDLSIKKIRVMVNGKLLSAADVTVSVLPEGSRMARPSGRGGGYSQKSQLPRSGIQPNKQNQFEKFFLKTEPDKIKVYKGEQIILTYALYTHGVQFVGPPQVERYPSTPGFLKEQMDVPILRGMPHFAPAVVGGKEYSRAVMAQYALFPVKTGVLKIDPFQGKFTYRSLRRRATPDMNDPFNMFDSFFQSMQAQQATRHSDWVEVEVLPLPADGQPENFSGLVGDFNITAAVDKYKLKVGESLHVKVKIDGKGHAGSMEGLNIKWPEEFELYEDKSYTNFFKTGSSERLFDFMLIPKVKGTYTIPEIELSMFDPAVKNYRVRKTSPVTIEVDEGSMGSVYIAKKGTLEKSGADQDIRYWMSDELEPKNFLVDYIAGGVATASVFFAALSLMSLAFGRRREQEYDPSKEVKQFREKVQQLTKMDLDPGHILAQVETCLGQILDRRYKIKKGSLTRDKIRSELDEKKVNSDIIKDVERLLENCENIRFMPGGGDRNAALSAVHGLASLIDKIYQ